MKSKIFYIFNDQGFDKSGNNTGQTVRIHNDAVTHVTSGLLDYNKTVVVGYLHKALACESTKNVRRRSSYLQNIKST